jgi:hypothetical protein
MLSRGAKVGHLRAVFCHRTAAGSLSGWRKKLPPACQPVKRAVRHLSNPWSTHPQWHLPWLVSP